MGFMDTIEKPWRHPVEYLTLAFWLVLFVIVAFAMADTLRVLAQWVEQSARS